MITVKKNDSRNILHTQSDLTRLHRERERERERGGGNDVNAKSDFLVTYSRNYG